MSNAQQYYENYGGETVEEYVERHLRNSPVENERIERLIALIDPGARSVLDVGAGHGLLLEGLAARRGLAGVGVEITDAKVEYARSRGVDLRRGDAAKLSFDDGEFDAVFCCEVLEHLPFGIFEAACAELARVARSQVIVSVPFDERRHFVRCPYCAASVNPNYHFRSFGAASMVDLLPGWRLEATFGLGRETHGWIKHFARGWLSRDWPTLLVCPSCGWRPAEKEAAARGASAGRWRSLFRWLPSPTRPLWRIAVYRPNVAQTGLLK